MTSGCFRKPLAFRMWSPELRMPGELGAPSAQSRQPQMALQPGFAAPVSFRLQTGCSKGGIGVTMRILSSPRRTLPRCMIAAPCSGVVRRQEQKALMATLEHPDGRFEETASSDFQISLATGCNPLPEEIDPKLLPCHVAIIMDGNSRWAESRGWPASIGHERGVRSLREVIELSCRWGIQALTVFAFSAENWHRPQMEITFLMTLFERVLQHELKNLMKEDVCTSIIGDVSRLPSSLQSLVWRVCDSTKANKGLKLTIALSYSGRQDIVEACKRLATKVADGSLQTSDITELAVDHEMGTSWMGRIKDPDLLIRTSGEQRLSNFMLWQMAYTELYFTNSLWPDFGEVEYLAAILSYQQRDRRFGGRSKPPS